MKNNSNHDKSMLINTAQRFTSAVKSLVSGSDIIASVAYILNTVLTMSVQMVFNRWRHNCDSRSSKHNVTHSDVIITTLSCQQRTLVKKWFTYANMSSPNHDVMLHHQPVSSITCYCIYCIVCISVTSLFTVNIRI